MKGQNYILAKQQRWAARKRIELFIPKEKSKQKYYVKELDENLFESLSSESRVEVSEGNGSELIANKNSLPKMHALYSSSALSVNVFHYWKGKDIYKLVHALKLCKKGNTSAKSISFEEKFKIFDGKIGPNIDVVIHNDKNSQIKALAIECKFREPYSTSTQKRLKSTYVDDIEKEWSGMPNLLELAKSISPKNDTFKYLDVSQLITHILGLKRKYNKGGFRLLYLWYDVVGLDGSKHREEIEKFKEIAKLDNIKFHSLSYQELFYNLKKDYYEGNEKYIDYLFDRYL